MALVRGFRVAAVLLCLAFAAAGLGACGTVSQGEFDQGDADRGAQAFVPVEFARSIPLDAMTYAPDQDLIDQGLGLCADAVASAYRGAYDGASPRLSERLSQGAVVVGSPIPEYSSPRESSAVKRSETDLYPVYCDGNLVGVVGCWLGPDGRYKGGSSFVVVSEEVGRCFSPEGQYALVELEGQNSALVLVSADGFACIGGEVKYQSVASKEESEAMLPGIDRIRETMEYSSAEAFPLP